MKATLSLIAALCLLVGLSACSGKENINMSGTAQAGSSENKDGAGKKTTGPAAPIATKAGSSAPEQSPKKEISKEEQQALLNKELLALVHNYAGLEKDVRLEKVRSVLMKGADVNTLNAFGESVLSDAVNYGDGSSNDSRLVELLLANGADVNWKKGSSTRTPFAKAAESGNLSVIRMLMPYRDSMPPNTMVHALVNAAYHRHHDVVQYLLDNGVVADPLYKAALFSAPHEAVKAWSVLAGKYAAQKEGFYRAIVKKNIDDGAQTAFSDNVDAIKTACAVVESELGPIHLERNYQREGFFFRQTCPDFDRLYSLQWRHCYMMVQSKYTGVEQFQAAIESSMAEARSAAERIRSAGTADMSGGQLIYQIDRIQFALDVYNDVFVSNRKKRQIINWHKNKNRIVRRFTRGCNFETAYLSLRVINKSLTGLLQKIAVEDSQLQKEKAALQETYEMVRARLPALEAIEMGKKGKGL